MTCDDLLSASECIPHQVGQDAPVHERVAVFVAGHIYVHEHGRPACLPVTHYRDGYETHQFWRVCARRALHACAHYGASLSPQVIIRQNEPGHSFFIVKEGEVQCFVNQKLVKTYGPSEYFGEGLIASDCV